MEDYRAQVTGALNALAIGSATSFTWFGEASAAVAPEVRRALTRPTARRFLLAELQLRLYESFYTRGRPVATDHSSESHARPTRGDRFVERLSSANSGSGGWEAGWTVAEHRDGEVLARRGGITVRVAREDCRLSSREGHPDTRPMAPGCSAGTALELRRPVDALSISPGYYVAYGDEELAPGRTGTIVRLYWNVTPRGGIGLVEHLTRRLNREGLAFELKVLADELRFQRCDAGVLYVAAVEYQRVAGLLPAVLRALASEMKSGVPAFTKRLAPGLGLAEQPQPGSSFGLQRSGILAEGAVLAWERGARAVVARLAAIEEAFADRGLDLARPYLNAASPDRYELPATPLGPRYQSRSHDRFRARSGNGSAAGAEGRATPNRGGLRVRCVAAPRDTVEGAVLIARALCRDAIWFGGRCTWLGEVRFEKDSGAAGHPPALGTLPEDLYSGTAGCAIFLAELSAATGDAQARCTARGALRQSIALLSEGGKAGPGLFTGWPGVAYTAARVAKALGEEEWLARAGRLVRFRAGPPSRRGTPGMAQHRALSGACDIVSGRAGALVAFTALAESLGAPPLLIRAVGVADGLIACAEISPEGLSWKSDIGPTRRNLVGLSHGAAGIGWSLLELFSATGFARFRQAAEDAFAYERKCFELQGRSWPDFRAPGRRRNDGGGSRAPAYWCHGAAGIALTRIRAQEILGGGYEEEVETGLRATREVVADALATGEEDLSLCHGLAGNAEILQEGFIRRHLPSPGRPDAAVVACRRLVDEVSGRVMEAIADPPGFRDWGFRLVDSPGLMLGWSGLGLFLLRLHDPSIPSVLLLRREDYA